MPNLNRSRDAVKSPSGAYSKAVYFRPENGEEYYLRFLTDRLAVETEDGSFAGGWITTKTHQNVPTRPAPAGHKGNWPAAMSPVCRYDPQFSDAGFADCFVCDFMMPSNDRIKRPNRVWALAVLREEYRDENGKVAYRDVMREVSDRDKEGNVTVTREEPAIVVVEQSHNLFFSNFEGYFDRNGTILDRDFWVKREGEKLETTYRIIGLDQTTAEDGTILDLRNAEQMARYLPDAAKVGSAKAAEEALLPIIENRMSDDFYSKFFDTRVPQGSTGSSTPVATSSTPATPPPDNDGKAISVEDLRSKLTGYSPEAEQTPVGASA